MFVLGAKLARWRNNLWLSNGAAYKQSSRWDSEGYLPVLQDLLNRVLRLAPVIISWALVLPFYGTQVPMVLWYFGA